MSFYCTKTMLNKETNRNHKIAWYLIIKRRALHVFQQNKQNEILSIMMIMVLMTWCKLCKERLKSLCLLDITSNVFFVNSYHYITLSSMLSMDNFLTYYERCVLFSNVLLFSGYNKYYVLPTFYYDISNNTRIYLTNFQQPKYDQSINYILVLYVLTPAIIAL